MQMEMQIFTTMINTMIEISVSSNICWRMREKNLNKRNKNTNMISTPKEN